MSKIVATEIEKAGTRSLMLTPLIIAAVLFIYKSNAAIKVLSSTWSTGKLAGKPGVVAFGQQVSAIGALQRSENYLLLIWPALTFGIFIAAAVRAFVSPRFIASLLGERSMKSQLTAGLAGAPLMLCSCCVSPVFRSVAESSQRLGPALGLMLASPSLNPAALTLTFMLFGPRIAGVRLLLAAAAVLAIGPLVEWRAGGHRIAADTTPSLIDESSGEQEFPKFLRSLGTVVMRTVPGVVLGVFVSMLIVQFLPAAVFATPGAKILAVLLTAAIAVPLALPTFLEIPLALSLLATGFPTGAAVALLFAGPAINLPSLWSVARVGGWKVSAIVAACVWAIAVIGGLLVG